MHSRRGVLRAAGVLATSGLAGCVYAGPFPFVEAYVDLREGFAAGASVSVPASVEVFVQNVDSKAVALRGAEVVLYDADRQRLGRRPLGDLSWRGADPADRGEESHDVGFGSTATAYHATHDLDVTVPADGVPEWVSLDYDEVWFGDEEEALARNELDGDVRASSPPPKFTADILAYVGERPAASTVAPDAYESVRLTPRLDGPGGPLLPDPTPSPTATPSPTSTPAESTGNGTASGTATGAPSRTSTGTPSGTPPG